MMIYTTIVNSPEWHAVANQMIQAGYAAVAVQSVMFDSEDWREFSAEEIAVAKVAIREVTERNFNA